MTDDSPHNDQNPTPYLSIIALAALYLLIRTIGGQPEDATAAITVASPLLDVRL
ncbi:hypothetical protein [Streptomyces olivochromogenes]|uniref:Uncharacterized protein n=1 Tax=Streptomyces olivochromogenes TaxID=1963 RepID=A0A250VT34_STROL|nr:hypothetical protein [Streptomyces olivochromogenes]GAX57285.1 hypothetical protein SO3561_08855 [Streptomyces olivochromogenes]